MQKKRSGDFKCSLPVQQKWDQEELSRFSACIIMIKFQCIIICTKISFFMSTQLGCIKTYISSWKEQQGKKSYMYLEDAGMAKTSGNIVKGDEWKGNFFSLLLFKISKKSALNANTFETLSIFASFSTLLVLPFVLLFANSKRIVWGMSGSNRTPCCNFFLTFFFVCDYFLFYRN